MKLRRLISDFFYFISQVTKPELPDRDEGISCMMVSRNEPFLELSIKSIMNMVDEIILVDSSNGPWKEEVIEVSKKYDIDLFQFFPDYKSQTRKALAETSKKWILRWDADMIALPALKLVIDKFKNQEKFLFITLILRNLELDFFHYDPKFKFHKEQYFFSFAKELFEDPSILLSLYTKIRRKLFDKSRVRGLPSRLGYSTFPFWFDRKDFNKVIGLHLRTIKPWSRIVEKKYQPKWALLPDSKKNCFNNSLSEYVEYNCNPLEKFNEMINSLSMKLEKYDGQQSKLLKEWTENFLKVPFKNSMKLKKELFKYVNRYEKIKPTTDFYGNN